MRKIELLVPASSLEVLKIAVIFGADAVYIGGEAFGLRAKAKNFSHEDMAEGIAFAHEHGVKAVSYTHLDVYKRQEQGRVYVLCPEVYDFDEAVEALQCVFGIVGISPVVIYEDQGFEQMGKDVVSYMKARYPEFSGTFKVYTLSLIHI